MGVSVQARSASDLRISSNAIGGPAVTIHYPDPQRPVALRVGVGADVRCAGGGYRFPWRFQTVVMSAGA
jgi:hypothetical protein